MTIIFVILFVFNPKYSQPANPGRRANHPRTPNLSAGSVWEIPGGGAEVAMDTFHGPRAEAPHPHSVVLDPSGDRVLAPDLGQDKIHVLDIGGARLHTTVLALRFHPDGAALQTCPPPA